MYRYNGNEKVSKGESEGEPPPVYFHRLKGGAPPCPEVRVDDFEGVKVLFTDETNEKVEKGDDFFLSDHFHSVQTTEVGALFAVVPKESPRL